MNVSRGRDLVIVCLVLVVFPVAGLVFYSLFTFSLGFLLGLVLDLLGAPAAGTFLPVAVLGAAAGVAGGLWTCKFAWPRDPSAGAGEKGPSRRPIERTGAPDR